MDLGLDAISLANLKVYFLIDLMKRIYLLIRILKLRQHSNFHLSIASPLFFSTKDLETATMGVEQNKPMFTPGVKNKDVFAAMARSQDATN